MLRIAAGSSKSPWIPLCQRGDWDQGVDAAMTVQQNAAGSLRVSLSSSYSPSPNSGGQGVDSDHEDGAGGFRLALPTLHVDSRLPHSRGKQPC
jgi:hypothetical protein